MKVTLANSKNEHLRKGLGFSLGFFLFGSLLYLFNKKIIKFLIFILFYALTLVWFAPTQILDKIYDFLPTEIIEYNYHLFGQEPFNVTLFGLIGAILFLLVRLYFAFNYKRYKVKSLLKNGYNAYGEVDVQTLKQYRVINAKKAREMSSRTGMYNYNRNPSDVGMNTNDLKKRVDLDLLDDAYKNGMISKEIYLQKRKEIEKR